MEPIDIGSPHCSTPGRYLPSEYVGQFLLCRGCGQMVTVEQFRPRRRSGLLRFHL